MNSGSWWWTGSLACCDSWGHKESDTTEQLNWTELNENYADFSARLETAISLTVIGKETKKQLEKLLAYENANQKCQKAIAPIHETGTITDCLKACCNLGSEAQKMQMLAETMAAAFRKGNEGGVTCGDKNHLKRDCPKKANKKLPRICPRCHRYTSPKWFFSFTLKQSLLEYLPDFLDPYPHKPSVFYLANLVWLLKELLFTLE